MKCRYVTAAEATTDTAAMKAALVRDIPWTGVWWCEFFRCDDSRTSKAAPMPSALTDTIIRSSPNPIAVLVVRLATQLNHREIPVAPMSRYPKTTRNLIKDLGV